ncbi:MAG: hypothetical protein D6731_21640 [Planctomycetota bacterium]|nr:MAG: hypothetical protein D6731_21640 [Planctomycetota bacterium]
MNPLALALLLLWASPIGVGPQGAGGGASGPAAQAPAPVLSLLPLDPDRALAGAASGEVRRYALDARPPAFEVLVRLRGAVTALAQSPAGPCAGTDAGAIVLLPGDPGGAPRSLGRHPGGVRALLCHQGLLFSAGGDGVVRAWDLAGQGEAGRLEGHEGPVTGLALARGLLWSVGWDRTLRGWKLERRIRATKKRPSRAAGKEVARVVAGERELTAVCAVGDALATACWDGGLRRWDVRKRRPRPRDLPRRPHQEWVRALASRDGLLAAAAPAESAVLLCDGDRSPRVVSLAQAPSALAFVGERLLAGRFDGGVDWVPLDPPGGAK